MNHNLPNFEPAKNILSLISADYALEKSIDEIHFESHNLEELYILLHSGVRQSVYIGTHIMDYFFQAYPVGTKQFPVVMLYRHLHDLGDSIGTLLRFGSTSTASILLKSLFEVYLGVEYILQGKTFHEDRAKHYYAGSIMKNLEILMTHDPSTEQGKRLHRILEKNVGIGKAYFSKRDYGQERSEVEKEFSEDQFLSEYRKKYKKAKSNKKRKEWYYLSSGAQSPREFAKTIGKEAEYVLLYQMISEIAHGTKVISNLTRPLEEEKIEIPQIRGPKEYLNLVANYTVNYLLKSHKLLIDTFFQSDQRIRITYLHWYNQYQKFSFWLKEEKK